MIRGFFILLFLIILGHCKERAKCHIGITDDESLYYRRIKNSDKIYSYSLAFRGFNYYIEKIHWDRADRLGIRKENIHLKEKDILLTVDDCGFSLNGLDGDLAGLPNCVKPREEDYMTKLHNAINGPAISYYVFKPNFLLKYPDRVKEKLKTMIVFRDGKELHIDLKTGKILQTKENRIAQRVFEFKRIQKIEGQWVCIRDSQKEFQIVNHYNIVYFYGKKSHKIGEGSFSMNYEDLGSRINIFNDDRKEKLSFEFVSDDRIRILEYKTDDPDIYKFDGEVFYRNAKNVEIYKFEREEYLDNRIEQNTKDAPE